MNYNIAQPFFESAQKHPDKLALFADGENYTYCELLDRVARVADWLATGDEGTAKRVGIFGSRSAEACIGILAAAWVGAAYVPISLKQPELGVAGLLQRSGLSALIADRAGSQMLSARVLEEAPAKILAVGNNDAAPSPKQIAGFDELSPAKQLRQPVAAGPDTIAYILYTSGSTGAPKGVMLPSRAVHHLLNVMETDYSLTHQDCMAETTDISFDLSVYNMFATWRAGASLHVIPPAQAMAPAKFVQEHKITTWLSVPSIAAFMSRMGLLKPGVFPSLRYTFFCGEPLLASVAEAWHIAAPNSAVVNMYGPTEAAVMCIGQEYSASSASTRDCVAIGRPFAGMQAAIAAGESQFAPSGEPGELLLAGPQLALGYLDDPEKTAARFVNLDNTHWYRTGDLAYCDNDGIFHYLGRIDNQVKILGYRVELEEIECHLRDASSCSEVAAVAWPMQSGSASGVVGFVVNCQRSEEEIKAALQQRLPSYMVPARVYVLPKLPLNNNGKVDRKALLEQLRDGVL
ncbi:MAG TPA: amino acid adenylation domain-containing protein [Terriglobales bacterium]|nr:amino acid adenylation domain-containing protein [Terriglobales bacterium]